MDASEKVMAGIVVLVIVLLFVWLLVSSLPYEKGAKYCLEVAKESGFDIPCYEYMTEKSFQK